MHGLYSDRDMFVDASMKPARLHRGMLASLMDETDLVIIFISQSIYHLQNLTLLLACSQLRRCLKNHLTFVKTSFFAGHFSEIISTTFDIIKSLSLSLQRLVGVS